MEPLFRFRFSSLNGINQEDAEAILIKKLKLSSDKAKAFLKGELEFKPMPEYKVDNFIAVFANSGIFCKKIDFIERRESHDTEHEARIYDLERRVRRLENLLSQQTKNSNSSIKNDRTQGKNDSFDFVGSTREQLHAKYKQIAEKLGDDQFFTKKELDHLPNVLAPQEQVLAFSSGMMDGNTWLIVLTNERVLFLDKGLIYGLKQISINLNRINSIECQTGLMFGSITIQDGASSREIKNVWKSTVVKFTNMVREQISDSDKRR